MAKLDRMQVEHVAKLAKLPISSSELTKFGEQLKKIADYVGKIGEIPITKHQISNKLQFRNLKLQTKREDKTDTGECLSQEEATGNAKNVHNGLFVAKAVFEE